MRWIAQPQRRGKRPGQSGQGMVEFALVMPVFFGALWALINGSMLLYSANAVSHSASVGADSIAASDDAQNADMLGTQRMAAAGMGTTALVNVSEIDVEELENSASGGYTTSAGAPVIQAGCTGAGSKAPVNPSDNGLCIDRYTFSGSGSSLTVTALDGTCTSAVDPSECPPWAPESRVVSNDAAGQSAETIGASYIQLVVHYRFTFFATASAGLNLTSTTVFRLEPET